MVQRQPGLGTPPPPFGVCTAGFWVPFRLLGVPNRGSCTIAIFKLGVSLPGNLPKSLYSFLKTSKSTMFLPGNLPNALYSYLNTYQNDKIPTRNLTKWQDSYGDFLKTVSPTGFPYVDPPASQLSSRGAVHLNMGGG